ncbi:hypothetical protein HD553DRAFT_19459 [Filobasidium floriforme]|uniref:uncharacterized protein n=1 Tax=Filobasidium floriforme TaxID=5210 RepID=UPI001E8D2934|nr:uncharacterized protein HD553DRAFT_19459 [Filobasidium floriforme]KAH8090877.1 hypothetical protein HD553DRAFT_19459 [Filobasidium floriforme]
MVPPEILHLIFSWLDRRDLVPFLLFSSTFDFAVEHIYRHVPMSVVSLLELNDSRPSLLRSSGKPEDGGQSSLERTKAYRKAVRVLIHPPIGDTDPDVLDTALSEPPDFLQLKESFLPGLQYVWRKQVGNRFSQEYRQASICYNPEGRILCIIVSPSRVSLPDSLKAIGVWLAGPSVKPANRPRILLGESHGDDWRSRVRTNARWDAPLDYHDHSQQVKRLRLESYRIHMSELDRLLESFPGLEELGINLELLLSYEIRPDMISRHGHRLKRIFLRASTTDTLDRILGQELPSLTSLFIRLDPAILPYMTAESKWNAPGLADLHLQLHSQWAGSPERVNKWLSAHIPRSCTVEIFFGGPDDCASLKSRPWQKDWTDRFKALRLSDSERNRGPPGFSLVA